MTTRDDNAGHGHPPASSLWVLGVRPSQRDALDRVLERLKVDGLAYPVVQCSAGALVAPASADELATGGDEKSRVAKTRGEVA